MHLGPEVFHHLGFGRSKAGRTPSIAYAGTHVCGVERRGDGHAGVCYDRICAGDDIILNFVDLPLM